MKSCLGPRRFVNLLTEIQHKKRMPDLSDIFKLYGKQFLDENGDKLSRKQRSVMYKIEHCRDGSFGFHVDMCDNCGYKETANNSCRDRHCSKCSSIASKKWVNARLKDLLPIPYYHAIFTIPHEFFGLSLFNMEIFYKIMFSCAASTLETMAKDPKWLGAKIGFYGILHTWGGKLWQHLHLHFIVTGGGLAPDGTWKELPYKSKFLFPVKAISKIFRGKFVAALKRAHKKGLLKFPEQYKELESYNTFEQWLYHTIPLKWVVHAKPPFKGPEEVVKYIGRYTHRVAISNQSINTIDNDEIVFKFKNAKKNRMWDTAKLSAQEFIRRLVVFHVLPNRFHRLRHYGILANGKCKENIKKIREQLKVEQIPVEQEDVSGITCPKCKLGTFVTVLIVNAFGRFVLQPLRELSIGDPLFDSS